MPPPADDGKLDATNGIAYGELRVKPIQLPNQEIVGLGTTVITNSGIKIFRPVGSDGVEYKEDEITHDGETYGFDDGPNGIARLKDLDSYKNDLTIRGAPTAANGGRIYIDGNECVYEGDESWFYEVPGSSVHENCEIRISEG